MRIITKIVGFVLLSIVWWGIATFVIFTAIFPCGMGPEATCDMGPEWSVWLAIVGALVGYVGVSGLLYQKWKS